MKAKVLKSVIGNLFIISMLAGAVLTMPSCDNKTADYNKIIVSADSAFNAGQYAKAKTLYKDAKVIKPKETYPDQQIQKVGQILRQQETDRKYTEAINRADNLFDAGNYQEAKVEYQKSSSLKPQESYPKQKISEIANILAEQQVELAAEKNPYHIIVGTFGKDHNANALHEKLKGMGYRSHLIPRYDGELTAVTIKSFPDLHAAWNHLPEVYEMEMFMDDSPWIVKYTIRK